MAMAMAAHGFAGDLLMDINIGQWILAHGHVAQTNVFTQALAHHPFSDTEWGFGLWVALAFRWGGRLGVYVSLLPFLAITSLFVGLWAQQVGSWRGLAVSVLAGVILMGTANPRPQIASYAAFALGIWAIQRARQGRWASLWVFFGAIVLWTNIHSSVVLAPALLVNEALWEGPPRLYRLQLLGAAILAAAFMLLRIGGLSQGSHFVKHVFSSGVTNVLAEWQSPNFHTGSGLILIPALLLGWGVLLPRLWRQREWSFVIWALGGPIATLWAMRFAPYMILGIAALGPAIGPVPTTRWARPARRVTLGTALAIPALWVGSMWHPGFFASRYPVAAEHYLVQHHAQDVLTYYNWGDSAEFAGLHPWVNGQAQLWAQTAWWLPMIQAQTSVVNITIWAHRWDSRAQWLLWPLNGSPPSGHPLAAQGWHLVFHTQSLVGPVGVWHKADGPNPSSP